MSKIHFWDVEELMARIERQQREGKERHLIILDMFAFIEEIQERQFPEENQAPSALPPKQ